MTGSDGTEGGGAGGDAGAWSSVMHPALAQLRGYWEALRVEGALPTRRMIDPRGIERALPYAFVVERVAPGVARLRVSGTQLSDLMGMEVRGMPLSVLFEPEARDAIAEAIEHALALGEPVELRLEAARGLGRPKLAAALLLLPLRDEPGEMRRLLGGLAASGSIGRAPRRFRLADSPVADVPAIEAPLGFPRDSDTRAPVPASGLAEQPARYTPPGTRGSHLRLVYSAD